MVFVATIADDTLIIRMAALRSGVESTISPPFIVVPKMTDGANLLSYIRHDSRFGRSSTWNEQTLLGNDNSQSPERRTALIAEELKRFNVDIAALQETRLSSEGSLHERTLVFTFYWMSFHDGVLGMDGVGFAVRPSLVSDIPDEPVGINERQMTGRIPLSNNPHMTGNHAYAPSLDRMRPLRSSPATAYTQ